MKLVCHIRVNVDISVFDTDTFNDRADIGIDQMKERVLSAIMPHPDSLLATSKAGERVTVLARKCEVLL